MMKVTILQTDIKWGAPGLNMERAGQLMDTAADADLYVLPEMWTTGFATAPHAIADYREEALGWMKEQARQRKAAVCGSVATAVPHPDGAGTRFQNRHYFVRPDGTFDSYDKHHLFQYGGEHLHYTAGQQRVTASFQGWRFLLLTCYDLRFPGWARYRNDYDAIIVVANWPESRRHAWDILTQARAIENQCYLIGCNRVGDDPTCHYTGGSLIVDPKGFPTAQATAPTEQTVSAALSMESLQQLRTKFRVLDERDNK